MYQNLFTPLTLEMLVRFARPHTLLYNNTPPVLPFNALDKQDGAYREILRRHPYTLLDPNVGLQTQDVNQPLPQLLPAFGMPLSTYDYDSKVGGRNHTFYMCTYAFVKALLEVAPPILQDYFQIALSEHYNQKHYINKDKPTMYNKDSYSTVIPLPVLLKVFKDFTIPRSAQADLLKDLYDAYTVNLSNFLTTIYETASTDNRDNFLDFLFTCYKPRLATLKITTPKQLLKSLISINTARDFGMKDNRTVNKLLALNDSQSEPGANIKVMLRNSNAVFPFYFLKLQDPKEHLRIFEMLVDANHFTLYAPIINQFSAQTSTREATTLDDPATNYSTPEELISLDPTKPYATPKNLRLLIETHHGVTFVTKPYPRQYFYKNKLFIDILKKLMYTRHFRFVYFYSVISPKKKTSKTHFHLENAMHLDKRAFSLPNTPKNLHATTIKERYNCRINVVPNTNNPSVIPCIRDYQAMFSLAGIQTFLYEDYFSYLSQSDLVRQAAMRENSKFTLQEDTDDTEDDVEELEPEAPPAPAPSPIPTSPTLPAIPAPAEPMLEFTLGTLKPLGVKKLLSINDLFANELN